MDPQALFKIAYGLYLLSVRSYGQDNACIINTAVQVSLTPLHIAVSVTKDNKTHDMIMESGRFNVCPLTKDAPFSLFERFGMQSGRDVNKFIGFEDVVRADNGILRLSKYTNAFMSAKLVRTVDLGSHTLFIAQLEEAQVLCDAATCTYDDYQREIKPKPKKAQKTTWVCKVCGYVYEGDELPDDFICPLCKHGKEDFEKIEA
ncbi:MAG: flavin reductase [Clostridia bacterium]|nr:flavin reductase [Clostridia bacterium]